MSARVVTWEADTPSLGPAVVAIGVFDGVHVGHQALIRDAISMARERGASSAVLTFDRDPDQVVTPDRAAPQLLALDDKLALIGALGVDLIVVVPFCVRIAETEPDRFLDDVLTQVLDPLAVVVGEDFRFGHRAAGDVHTLERYGAAHGFEVVDHELVVMDGAPVTSTRARNLIAAGRVADAARLLGRPHRVTGRVTHGRGEGARVLGIPTANLVPTAHSALPAPGVYAGWATVAGERLPAAVSVGEPPTFPGALHVLEAHVLGFSGELYGADLVVEFAERLREQRAFSSAEELAAQMRADIARVTTAEGGRDA